MINDKQKEILKRLVAAKIEKTKKKIANYQDMSQPIKPENSLGRISRMDAINNKSVVEAALRTAEEKLHNLELITGKIDDEDFGICIRCKNEIPPGRIVLMPESRYCVRCADR